MKKNNYDNLVSRIAADKDNNKLGKIIRIEKLPGKTIKKHILHAMISVQSFWKKNVVVPIDVKKIIQVDGNYVWFDIIKTDFDEEVKRLRKTKLVDEIYTGDLSVRPGKTHLGRVDTLNLHYKRKERRR